MAFRDCDCADDAYDEGVEAGYVEGYDDANAGVRSRFSGTKIDPSKITPGIIVDRTASLAAALLALRTAWRYGADNPYGRVAVERAEELLARVTSPLGAPNVDEAIEAVRRTA